MEICLPTGQQLTRLELFLKKAVKQILSLPVNVADAAVYILSGILPAEALIDMRALNLLGAICRLPKESVEYRLAERQLRVKTRSDNSWFVAMREICLKYTLPDPLELLDNRPAVSRWKRLVRTNVHKYWKYRIVEQAQYYTSLRHLNTTVFEPGRPHPIMITVTGNPRDVTRLVSRLRLATGTYILQSNRKAFNQNEISATCLLCNEGDETKDHFIMSCKSLEDIRRPIMDTINTLIGAITRTDVNGLVKDHLQIIMDNTGLFPQKTDSDLASKLNFHMRRLCYQLHVTRYRLLEQSDHIRRRRRKRR